MNPTHRLEYGNHISGFSDEGLFVFFMFLILLVSIYAVYEMLKKKIEKCTTDTITSSETGNDVSKNNMPPSAEELANKWGKELVVLETYTATEQRCDVVGIPTHISIKFEQAPAVIGRLLYYKIDIEDSRIVDMIPSSDKNRVRRYDVNTGMNKIVVEIHGSEQIMRKEFNMSLMKNDYFELVAKGEIFGLETVYKG